VSDQKEPEGLDQDAVEAFKKAESRVTAFPDRKTHIRPDGPTKKQQALMQRILNLCGALEKENEKHRDQDKPVQFIWLENKEQGTFFCFTSTHAKEIKRRLGLE